jgi:hypothetical protein
MGFLDNLENNLNALERLEQKDPEQARRDQERRETDRSAALKRQPYAEALKKSAFTGELMTQCRAIGHGQRVLVQFTWLGENLRLDAKNKRLELMPTAEGILAVYSRDGAEIRRANVNTETDDAGALSKEWLTGE